MNSSRYGGRAHKTPCENSGCGQNLCVEARKHPGATLHLKCVICLGKDAEIARLKEHLATTEADRKGQVVDTQKYRDMWLDAEAKLVVRDEEIKKLRAQAEGLCDGCGKGLEDAYCTRCYMVRDEAMVKPWREAVEAVVDCHFEWQLSPKYAGYFESLRALLNRKEAE